MARIDAGLNRRLAASIWATKNPVRLGVPDGPGRVSGLTLRSVKINRITESLQKDQ